MVPKSNKLQSLAKDLRDTVLDNSGNDLVIQWHDGFTARVTFSSVYEPTDADEIGEVESFSFRIKKVIAPIPARDLGNYRGISISINSPPKEIQSVTGKSLWLWPFQDPGFRTFDQLIHCSNAFEDESLTGTLAYIKDGIDGLRFATFWKEPSKKDEQISEIRAKFLRIEKLIPEPELNKEALKGEVSSFRSFLSMCAKDYKRGTGTIDPGFGILVFLCDRLATALSQKPGIR